MAINSHQDAPTQYVEAAGIRFAYRRFGRPAGVPLVFFMHFTGTMDHWGSGAWIEMKTQLGL